MSDVEHLKRVGHSKIFSKSGVKKIMDYEACDRDHDGFVDSKKFVPLEYDLVNLLTKTGKIRMGWWEGKEFFSSRLKKDEVIVAWKKSKEFF